MRRRSSAVRVGRDRMRQANLKSQANWKRQSSRGARDMTLDAAMLRRCAEHCATFLDGSVDAQLGRAHTGYDLELSPRRSRTWARACSGTRVTLPAVPKS